MKVPFTNFTAQFEESSDNYLNAIEQVLRRGDFILGEAVGQFEAAFAELCGVKYAVAVGNGTDALILALRSLDIGPGHEVITVANSWVSSVSAIVHVGATPVFVDVGPDQLMDVSQVEARITKRTKAILPVHLTGRCVDMGPLLTLAKVYGIHVIEDSAQAVLSERSGLRAGASGVVGCFSLHPLKNLNACGDGGVVTTNDLEVAEKLRLLRNHGLKTRDEIVLWGFNSRLDTLQAAILLKKLPLLKGWIQRRQDLAQLYVARLHKYVECPNLDFGSTFHLFVIQCDHRDSLQTYLLENGVETKIHYPVPIHLQPPALSFGFNSGDLPQTELQARRILSLPIHQYLIDEQVEHVCRMIVDFFESSRFRTKVVVQAFRKEAQVSG